MVPVDTTQQYNKRHEEEEETKSVFNRNDTTIGKEIEGKEETE